MRGIGIIRIVSLSIIVGLVLSGMASAERLFPEMREMGNMSHGRYNHTSEALLQGELIVIGGTTDGYDSMSSTEILKDGEWSSGPQLSVPRQRHASATLPSGSVFVSGGFQGDGGSHPSTIQSFKGRSISLSSCEILDADLTRWTLVAPMITGRFWHALVELPSGDLMAIGGLNSTVGAIASCEIYKVDEDRWVKAAPLSSPRARFTATVLDDGSILVAGGHNGSAKKGIDSCEIYDPYTDKWTPAAPMNEARGFHAAMRLKDGRVIVSGGFSAPGAPDRNTTEIYDPITDEWTVEGDMSFPRHNHVFGILPDGRVLALGGSNCQTGGSHSNVEVFDPSSGTWSETGIIMTGRIWLEASVLTDGSVVTTGGKACDSAFTGAESFSLKDDVRDTGFIPFAPLMILASAMAVWRLRICRGD
jgi:hypothetical protein